MDKYLMILGGSETQMPFIRYAHKKGFKVIVTDKDKNAYSLKHADIALNVDAINKEEVLMYAKQYNILGILTKTEILLKTVSYVSEKLNLIGLSTISANASHDKALLRKMMNKNNITTPKYWIISNLDDLKKDNIEYPVVMKPIDSGGSRGVVKINNEVELRKKFEQTKLYSIDGKVILEEYLDGREFSVETITQKGKTFIVAITEKTTSGLPYFVETRHIIPANITHDEYRLISNMVIRTLKAISLDNSIAHTELKLTSKGPIIIEMGARFGGDYIATDLVSLSTGIDMYKNLIKVIIDEDIDIAQKYVKTAGVQFAYCDNYEGFVNNLQKAKRIEGYIKSELYNRKNENKITNSSDRLGYCIFVKEDRKSLVEVLDFVKGV